MKGPNIFGLNRDVKLKALLSISFDPYRKGSTASPGEDTQE